MKTIKLSITSLLMCLSLIVSANDECVDATILGNLENFQSVTYNTTNATQSTLSSCDNVSFSYADIWYTFTMPFDGQIRLWNVSSLYSITIYDNCSSTELSCDSGNQYLRNLIGGQSYVIRYSSRDIYKGSGSFNIQAFGIVSNDECVSAIDIGDISTLNLVNFDNRGATETTDGSCEIATRYYHDLFYSFTMPYSGKIRLTDVSSLNTVSIYTDCSLSNEIYCSSSNGFVDGLSNGTTYILRYSVRDIYTGEDDFAIQAFEPVANDDCFGAELIPDISTSQLVNFDVRGATQTSNSSCDNDNNVYLDLWYEFVMPFDGQIHLTDLSSLHTMTLRTPCEFEAEELDCINGNGFMYNLIGGQTYNLVFSVRDIYAGADDFRIIAVQPEPNDECENRITIPDVASGQLVLFDTRGATESTDSECDNALNNNHDIWYEFTMPFLGNIHMTDVSGLNIVTLYDGCGGAELACANGNTFFYDLTPNTTYVLRYSMRDIYAGPDDFHIQAWPKIINDECADAIEINSVLNLQTIVFEPRGASESLDGSCETAASINHDFWYNFTMPCDGSLQFTDVSGLHYVVLYDACGGNEIGCLAGNATFTGLTGDTEYFFKYSMRDVFATNAEDFAMQVLPDALGIDVEISNSDCNSSSGSISITTVSCGIAPYTYQWSTGETTPDLVNIPVGVYIVTVTDAIGTTVEESITVDSDEVDIQSSIATVNETCGLSNGSIDLTILDGQGPYSFLWDNGATTEDLNNLSAGIYNVTITDANGCIGNASAQIVDDLVVLDIQSTVVDAICENANGSIDITVSGDGAPFSYQWSNGANTEDIDNLNAGTYALTITDANGCTLDYSETVNLDSYTLTLTATIVDEDCEELGSILVMPSGGLAPYDVFWFDDFVGAFRDDLAAGTYPVFVYDANGCVGEAEYIVNDACVPCPNISLEVASSEATCTSSDGSANVVGVNGGLAPYTYVWSNGAIGPDLTDVPFGLYTVTVTDAEGCTGESDIFVEQIETEIGLSFVTTDENCGNSNGAISSFVIDAQEPISYLWSNGSTDFELTDVSSGVYTLTLTDANGCTVVQSGAVGEFNYEITFESIITDESCDLLDGAIEISPIVGIEPYTFQWSTGDVEQEGVLNDLAEGSYEVTVTDANGCVGVGSFDVEYDCLECPAISAEFEVMTPSCLGEDGSASVISVSGGVASYSFVWSNGDNDDILNNVTSGTYQVTITDANGCTGEEMVIVPPYVSDVLIEFDVTNATCGNPNGSITANVSNATDPISYFWSNGAITNPAEGLSPGAYDLTIVDGEGCTFFAETTVGDDVYSLDLVGEVVDVSCDGDDGIIDLTVLNGTAPFSYIWSNGSTQEDLSDLIPATYTVTVIDANGCSGSASFTVRSDCDECPEIALTFEVVSATCELNDGSASVISVSGGVASYTFIWDTGTVGPDLTNVSSGQYTVTVTDADNCTDEATVEITDDCECPFISFDTSILNPTCQATDGAVSIAIIAGGVAPYTIAWSTGATGTTLLDIPAGTYGVTLTDANGCTAIDDNIVVESDDIIIFTEAFVGDATCDNADGFIDIAPANGEGPFVFSWSNGENTEDIFNLVSDVYTVTITDANGCIGVESFEVFDDCTDDCIVEDEEDFESGWGNWIDGGVDARRSIFDMQYANSGVYCVRLRDNSGIESSIYTEVADYSIYESAEIYLSFYTVSMEIGERFLIEVSTDGGNSFTIAKEFISDTDFFDEVRYFETVNIEGFTFTNQTVFRIRCDASSNGDLVYLDDVIISGCGVNDCTTETFDDLEAGTGVWNLPSTGTDARRSIFDAPYANSGSYCFRIRDNSGEESSVTTSDLALSAFSSLKVNFSFITVSMEIGERFVLEVSTDGGASYNIYEEWISDTDFFDEIRYFTEATIDGLTLTDQTRVRIRCDASSNGDLVFIDDISIIGCNGEIPSESYTIMTDDQMKYQNENVEVLKSSNKNFLVYPNPVHRGDQIIVEFEAFDDIEEIVVTDVNGRIVDYINNVTTTHAEFSTTNYNSGMYIIQLKGKTRIYTSQIEVFTYRP